MCTVAIIDASAFNVMLAPKGEDKIFFDWIDRKHGILAYTNAGKYGEELAKYPKMVEKIIGLRRDRAMLIREDKLNSMMEKVEGDISVKSNDQHVLALALETDARILCAKDGKLRKDYQNSEVIQDKFNGEQRLYPLHERDTERSNFLGRRRCPKRKK